MPNNNHKSNGLAQVPISSLAGPERPAAAPTIPHTGLMQGVVAMQPGFEFDLGYRQQVKEQVTEACVRALIEVLSDARNYVVRIDEPRIETAQGGQRIMLRQVSVMLLHVNDAALGEHVSAAGSPPELREAGCFELAAKDGPRYFVLDEVAWRRVTQEEYGEMAGSKQGQDPTT
jgi:hypothetical protein